MNHPSSHPARNHTEFSPQQPADPLTIEELMNCYYPSISRLAYSILGDPDEADDAAQETFIRAAAHLADLDEKAAVKTWLYTIAVNACRMELRRRRRRLTLEGSLRILQALLQRGPSVEEVVLENEAQDHLRQAVSRLDEKHRLPVILRYTHQIPAGEIAQILHIREGTVHSRLHYAREKLARLLETDQDAAKPARSAAKEGTR